MLMKPQIAPTVFIAPNATVIGQVELAEHSSVWFGAVLRGDGDRITIGERTNIQDLACIHVDPGKPVHIGQGCIIGHAAIVHGATVGNHTLIGMRATILNKAKIGNYCIIGAHSLVTEGMEIPDYSVVMGTPAKVVKQVKEAHVPRLIENANHYVDLAQAYIAGKFD